MADEDWGDDGKFACFLCCVYSSALSTFLPSYTFAAIDQTESLDWNFEEGIVNPAYTGVR